jgi:hypothetical protein
VSSDDKRIADFEALVTETKNTHKKARNAWLAQWIFGILLLVKLGGKYRTGAACKSAHTNACI